MKIDLNADVGEGMGDDEGILAFVSSCNIACGGHAGDEASMRRVLRAAADAGVACGAHPSFPDPEGFGRRPYGGTPSELSRSLRDQLRLLMDLAAEEGVGLTHVKPHGALYNQAARDIALAALLLEVVAQEAPGLTLLGPPSSALEQSARARDVAYVAEGFADRRYLASGALAPRSEAGAVIVSAQDQIRQALRLARGEGAETTEGTIALPVQTICLHGDTPGVLQSAEQIRRALEEAGFEIEAPYG